MPARNGEDSQSSYRIFITDEYLKKLSGFSSKDRSFIENKTKTYIFPQLKKEPHYGINIRKLSGYEPQTWRYRLGKFRIFYLINDSEKIIYLLTVEFRKDAY